MAVTKAPHMASWYDLFPASIKIYPRQDQMDKRIQLPGRAKCMNPSGVQCTSSEDSPSDARSCGVCILCNCYSLTAFAVQISRFSDKTRNRKTSACADKDSSILENPHGVSISCKWNFQPNTSSVFTESE